MREKCARAEEDARGQGEYFSSLLSLDLDYAGSARQFEVINIPPPTIVVTNRANGHCHYLYRLRTPVAYHDQARKSPQAFFEAVQQELTIQMKADRAFNQGTSVNPLWHQREGASRAPTMRVLVF